MNTNSITSDSINTVCEALGCNSSYTERVAVRVGAKGTIFLFLCKNCKGKFSHDLINENSGAANA
jgi:hypothetical protein